MQKIYKILTQIKPKKGINKYRLIKLFENATKDINSKDLITKLEKKKIITYQYKKFYLNCRFIDLKKDIDLKEINIGLFKVRRSSEHEYFAQIISENNKHNNKKFNIVTEKKLADNEIFIGQMLSDNNIVNILTTEDEYIHAVVEKIGNKFYAIDFDNKAKDKIKISGKRNDINVGDIIKINKNILGRDNICSKYEKTNLNYNNVDDLLSLYGIHNEPKARKDNQPTDEDNFDGYIDLTKKGFITIDPFDAKDHDDAIFVERDDRNFILYVAIADVSNFVQKNTKEDLEALKRGNSIYLPDRVIPMLNKELSENLCSLNKQGDKKTICSKITIDVNGNIKKFQFIRAKIRIKDNFSYDQFEEFLSKNNNETYIADIISLFKILQNENKKRGPLNIHSRENKIIINGNNVEKIILIEPLESFELIEFMMVSANRCAAFALLSENKVAIHRLHENPPFEKINELNAFLQNYSLSINYDCHASDFNMIVKKCKKMMPEKIITEQVLKSQNRAKYSTADIGHFGLSLPYYCHFTSPIRRYADLFNHRQIKKYCLNKEYEYIDKKFDIVPGDENIAIHLSNLEKYAEKFERKIRSIFISKYYLSKKNETFEAMVISVMEFGIFLSLETGAEGFIHRRNLSGMFFDKEKFQFRNRKKSKIVKLGNKYQIKIKKINSYNGKMEFAFAN